uniref:Uncharacterized protein n=1 Tax=Anguilla anguilla TaxID=7936 RepID=A0A0E9VD71_ANGAN
MHFLSLLLFSRSMAPVFLSACLPVLFFGLQIFRFVFVR